MPNQPDQGNRDEQIKAMTTTLDGLFVDLARAMQSDDVTRGSEDICDLGALARNALASSDRLTVLYAQAQLLLAATRLLVQFGEELGRGED